MVRLIKHLTNGKTTFASYLKKKNQTIFSQNGLVEVEGERGVVNLKIKCFLSMLRLFLRSLG
jgi:hypothetical protein